MASITPSSIPILFPLLVESKRPVCHQLSFNNDKDNKEKHKEKHEDKRGIHKLG